MIGGSGGYWTMFRLRGVPVRVHWSVPLGMLVFTGFRVAPGAWAAFFVLILAHELGHAAMVLASRAQVLSVEVSGIGGLCRWRGSVTSIQRAVIAFGGVWAQLLLLVVALVLTRVAPPSSLFLDHFLGVMIETNLFLMAVNLLPVVPLDGSEAWALFPLLYQRWRGRRILKYELDRHLKVVPPPTQPKPKPKPKAEPAPKPDDPKRDEIFQRMVDEATRNPQPLDPDDLN